jgi:hypothetical protein
MSTPPRMFSIAANVIDAASTAIATGPTAAFATKGVVTPGEIAWDNCNNCGLLLVAMTRMFLTDQFPVEASLNPQGNCPAAFLAADFTLAAIRCVPVPDSQGKGPTVEQLTASAQEIIYDAEILVPAVACELEELMRANTIVDYVLRQAIPAGPMGGCGGSNINFSVAINRVS